MAKPPDVDRDPIWGPGFAIPRTPYVVLGTLGHGGMGIVYEVQNCITGLHYAFKVLSADVDEYPQLAERIVREAEFLHLIKGAPHVVTVVDWGRLHDALRRPYIVMERLYGETLATLLARHALPLTDTLSYLRHVLWGVAAVHGAGVVHRDIKPSNIFVRRDGTCTLIDFSIMKALHDIGLTPGQFPTVKGTPIGTPFYMAPEQASGATVDQRADIFSVGLVLIECLLGFRPLSHLSQHEYLNHLITEGVPSLELVGGEHLPREVRQLARCATMRDPDKRFPVVHAFLLEINRIAERLSLHLRPIPPSVHLASGALPPRAAGRHAAPTPSGYDSKAPTPRMHRAPLAPSGRDALQRGAAAGLAAPPTSSALPTQVDSVSPTRVKTPPPPSGPESTPPRRSQWRHAFGLLSLGWNGPAPKSFSPRRGKGGEPPPTLPVVPKPAGALRVPKFDDRLVLRPGMLCTPANNVVERPAPAEAPLALEPSAEAQPALEPSAEAQPALEPSAEAQPALEPSAEAPHGGASPVSDRPPLGPFVAIMGAGVVVSVVASLAVVWWAGPPATVVRASSEPLPASPAGVVASAEVPAAPAGVVASVDAPAAPAPEPPAEPEPSEASPPARLPKVAPSSAGDDRRMQLEAKLRGGKGTENDVEELVLLCFRAGDDPCVRQAQVFRKKLEGRR
jgi:serine/threonine protein kinase